jgi:hypothetical protein
MAEVSKCSLATDFVDWTFCPTSNASQCFLALWSGFDLSQAGLAGWQSGFSYALG